MPIRYPIDNKNYVIKTEMEVKVEKLEEKVAVLEKEVDELKHQMKYIATLR